MEVVRADHCSRRRLHDVAAQQERGRIARFSLHTLQKLLYLMILSIDSASIWCPQVHKVSLDAGSILQAKGTR